MFLDPKWSEKRHQSENIKMSVLSLYFKTHTQFQMLSLNSSKVKVQNIWFLNGPEAKM